MDEDTTFCDGCGCPGVNPCGVCDYSRGFRRRPRCQRCDAPLPDGDLPPPFCATCEEITP